jgi:hypothetical protein
MNNAANDNEGVPYPQLIKIKEAALSETASSIFTFGNYQILPSSFFEIASYFSTI